MYEVFDQFLTVETWHTSHDQDRERFFLALHKVVRDNAFSPEEMGDYIRQKPPILARDNDIERCIQYLVSAAWWIREYVKATGH